MLSAGSVIHFVLAFVADLARRCPSAIRHRRTTTRRLGAGARRRRLRARTTRDTRAARAGDPASAGRAGRAAAPATRSSRVDGAPVQRLDDQLADAVAAHRPAGHAGDDHVVRDGSRGHAAPTLAPTRSAVKPTAPRTSRRSASAPRSAHRPGVPVERRRRCRRRRSPAIGRRHRRRWPRIPATVPQAVRTIAGDQRDPDRRRSASSASAGSAARSLRRPAAGQIAVLLLLIASLNIFVGMFNLLPLLPLDGGHIAIVWFERVRAWLYARLRPARPGPGGLRQAACRVTYAVIAAVRRRVSLLLTVDRRHRQPDHASSTMR